MFASLRFEFSCLITGPAIFASVPVLLDSGADSCSGSFDLIYNNLIEIMSTVKFLATIPHLRTHRVRWPTAVPIHAPITQ